MADENHDASEFILKLTDMINIYDDIIGWAQDQNQIVIKDLAKLTEVVLPKYFRHAKFESFVRQLNMYNFHKVCREKSSMIYFKNDVYYKGNEQNFSKIKRKRKNDFKAKANLYEDNIAYINQNSEIQVDLKKILILLLNYKKYCENENKKCLNVVKSMSDELKGVKHKKFQPVITELSTASYLLEEKSKQIDNLFRTMRSMSESSQSQCQEKSTIGVADGCFQATKTKFETETEQMITDDRFKHQKSDLRMFRNPISLNSSRSITSFMDIFKNPIASQPDNLSSCSISLEENES